MCCLMFIAHHILRMDEDRVVRARYVYEMLCLVCFAVVYSGDGCCVCPYNQSYSKSYYVLSDLNYNWIK